MHLATIRKAVGSIPVGALEFCIDIIHPAALKPWGLTQPLTEMSAKNISWGVKAAGA